MFEFKIIIINNKIKQIYITMQLSIIDENAEM